MKEWIKKELGPFLTMLLLMLSGCVIGVFVAKYKLDLQYAEEMASYQEALYEANLELTEAEVYVDCVEDVYEMQIDSLEDYYEMRISLISANYRLQIEQARNTQGIAADDLETYTQLIDMFGSLDNFMNFLIAYEYRVRTVGYISLDTYYSNYWDN